MAITPEQFWKLYGHLPAELKETIFSQETADHIYDSCTKNGLAEGGVPQVASLVGDVLLGLSLPEEFQKSLEKEGGIKKDAAVNIAREITRFVFFPLKESLSQLHKIGVAPQSSAAASQTNKAVSTIETPSQEAAVPTTPRSGSETLQGRTTKKEDAYRESFEEESQ